MRIGILINAPTTQIIKRSKTEVALNV